MSTRSLSMIVPGVCGLAFLLGAIGPAWADDAKTTYPAMAPVEQYENAVGSRGTRISSWRGQVEVA